MEKKYIEEKRGDGERIKDIFTYEGNKVEKEKN